MSKSKIIITKDMTKEQRLAVIKKRAKAMQKKFSKSRRVRLSETSFMDRFTDGQNINQWTDAPKYLDEYYGDRVRDQKCYESEEGWN
jgi:hypothetical protein